MTTAVFGASDQATSFIKSINQDIVVVDSFKTGKFENRPIITPPALLKLTTIQQYVICTYNGFENVYNFLSMSGIENHKIFILDYNNELQPVEEVLKLREKCILVCTQPKSGTVWYVKNMTEATRRNYAFQTNPICYPKFGDEAFFVSASISHLMRIGGLSVAHSMTNSDNNKILSHNLDNGLKLIVNFRDPRQMMVSWFHHIQKKVTAGDIDTPRTITGAYFETEDEAKRKEILVEKEFPKAIKWVLNWMDFCNQVNNDKYLVTRQEDMALRPKEFNKKVADYLEIKESMINLGGRPTPGKFHYRKGTVNEWESCFSEESLNYMNEQMDKHNILNFLDSIK